MRHLQLRKPLDGFQRAQNSQNSKRLYRLDVSAFVVPVGVKIRHSGIKLRVQNYWSTGTCGSVMEFTLDSDNERGRDREREREKEKLVKATSQKHHVEDSFVCEEGLTGAWPGSRTLKLQAKFRECWDITGGYQWNAFVFVFPDFLKMFGVCSHSFFLGFRAHSI